MHLDVEHQKAVAGTSRAWSGILLLSELFPPAVGGSAELFWNIYSRVEAPVTVVTKPRALGTETDSRLRVAHAAMPAKWGLLNARSLVTHARLAGTIAGELSRNSSIVHCGRALPEGTVALMSRMVRDTRYVCWAHGEELAYVLGSRELTFLARQVLTRSAALIANSQSTARMLQQFDVPPSRVTVVYPGVDSDRFRPDIPGADEVRRRIMPGDGCLLLTVGRLQKRKGHDLVIEALASMRDVSPRLHYAIVGDGDERETLRRLVGERGLESRVSFIGGVAAEDLPKYYAAADIFVHPNRRVQEDFEGFGIVFLEAAAAALPVIAGRSGGAPEAAQEGVTAVLVSGTDADELGSAIRALVADPHRRQAMGQAGRARVVAGFTWGGAAERVMDVHRSLCARG